MDNGRSRLARLLARIVKDDQRYDIRRLLVLDAVALAATLGYPAGFGYDSVSVGPEFEGRRIVAYIELPEGQVSWHMPEHPHEFDGHTTPEKFERIEAFAKVWS